MAGCACSSCHEPYAALTDLHTITLIQVTLPMQPDQEGSMSVQVSEACPGVRDTLLQLLSSHPSDLQVNMPDLGPSFEAIDFLGHGATSHVYKAVKGEQKVSAHMSTSLG